MKIELNDISSVKKCMTVEVPADMVAHERKHVVEGYAAKANVPGFRPGKVPLSVIETRFAKELREDIRERAAAGDISPGLPLWGEDAQLDCPETCRDIADFLVASGLKLAWNDGSNVPS